MNTVRILDFEGHNYRLYVRAVHVSLLHGKMAPDYDGSFKIKRAEKLGPVCYRVTVEAFVPSLTCMHTSYLRVRCFFMIDKHMNLSPDVDFTNAATVLDRIYYMKTRSYVPGCSYLSAAEEI